MNIVDRRANPKGKSLPNRERFVDRAKGEIRQAVSEALRKRKVSDIASEEKISISSKGIVEPNFRLGGEGGRREQVVPGNKEFVAGDRIPRPPGSSGQGGREASADGSGEDSFEFALSKDEFLDILFEDMELPDLIKTDLTEAETYQLSRAGHTKAGSPSNLNLARTMRNSLARRISLGRPRQLDLEALEEAIARAEAVGDLVEVERLQALLTKAHRRAKVIAYIDPSDVRYNLFQRIPKPNSQAVMFCLMDVSGSMTEHMKDLAKRFFMLLHVFLERRYRKVDLVFIRHTTVAEEVDEQTFFHGRETGGTVVSTALEEMLRVVRARYPLDAWNVYGAQASDGDNLAGDGRHCIALLDGEVLPLSQYFAYIEVGERPGGVMGFSTGSTNLWRTYAEVAPRHQHFAMRKVSEAAQIFPVFHDLFAKDRENA